MQKIGSKYKILSIWKDFFNRVYCKIERICRDHTNITLSNIIKDKNKIKLNNWNKRKLDKRKEELKKLNKLRKKTQKSLNYFYLIFLLKYNKS